MKDQDEGYIKIGPPKENPDTLWWRLWLAEIIFGLWNEKKKILAEMDFPPRPIRQQEIIAEAKRRMAWMKREKIWKHTSRGHNWIERRVNELVKEEFGPRNTEGVLKIVRMRGDNLYEPNPKLFKA